MSTVTTPVARPDAQLASLSSALERAASWIRRAAPPTDLNLVGISVLDAIATQGPLRITELAQRERVSQPGMTGIVTRLSDAGLVERRGDDQDGRVARVHVTAAGRRYLAERRRARSAVLAAHICQLSPAHRRALYAAAEALEALSASPAS